MFYKHNTWLHLPFVMDDIFEQFDQIVFSIVKAKSFNWTIHARVRLESPKVEP